MIMATFCTNDYGAQLSFNYDWEAGTSWFLLLTAVDGKKETKVFTYFADAVDAYEDFKVAEIYRDNTKVLDEIEALVKNEFKNTDSVNYLMPDGELQLHSDQGFQYTSQAYFNLTQSYGITPSMSRHGNPYDNAMAENFFSILKTECIYRTKLQTYEEASHLIGQYIHFYNNERIQLKTKLTSLEKRNQFVAKILIFSTKDTFFVLSAQSGAVQ